nr:carbon-nitrogen hydrolase family protein [Rhodococcus wratislaviensis]GLK33363.1 putative hydrolase [Rhodococcus wratislaviensis]
MIIKISGLQTEGEAGNPQENLAELNRAAETAASHGSNLLITPELFVTGYDIGTMLLTLAERDWLTPVRDIAVAHDIALLVGLPEKIPGVGVFNSAVFVDSNGDVLGVHRKTHLFGDIDKTYFEAGNEPVTVVDFRGVRVGVMICYDVEFPENTRMAALAGAELLAVPTAQMEPFEFVAENVIRTRAWENQVYVAYVNHTGREGDTSYVGRSSIVGPDASVLDQLQMETGLIHATVDTTRVQRAQRQNPYLSDIRPGLYHSLVRGKLAE